MRFARFFLLAALGLCHCVEPVLEEPVELCHRPGDEDGNGLVNVDDPACKDQMAIVLRETCTNQEDDDGDGFTDCDDTECEKTDVCTIEQCDLPGDEDGNGLFNADDPVCAGKPTLSENCTDNFDNDGDGKVDCDDSECFSARSCIPEDCIAPEDEDGDGKVNCADEDCRADGGFPACSSVEGSRCSNSMPFVCQGGENMGLLADFLHSCLDNNDNDFDGFSDCNDADCKNSCACRPCEEVCGNSEDDDEDGVVDNGCPCVSTRGTLGVCADSTINPFGVCGLPRTFNPNVDTCGDNLDNDCNGSVDDGCACNYLNIPVGVCADGIIQANGTCGRPTGYFDVESNNLCQDNIDNDCDGQIDDADSQCQ